jgi:uncharacterized protein (UPF0147 family)
MEDHADEKMSEDKRRNPLTCATAIPQSMADDPNWPNQDRLGAIA